MDLFLILDLAIGLIFIYLILSLLASEIQELIATLFQWRAEHLKKSIEILLSGNTKSEEEEARVIQLANRLYSNPLITNINQEAKGWVTTLPRKMTWAIGSMYRAMKNPRPGTRKGETIFGDTKHSGPSYIPAETFATTLLETLAIPTLVKTLVESRLEKFQKARIKEIEEILEFLKENTQAEDLPALNTLTQELEEVREDFKQIFNTFISNKASLNTSLTRMAESIDRYIDFVQAEIPKNQLYGKSLRRMKVLRKDIFDNIDNAILLGGLRPNITEVVQSINTTSAVYQEIEAAIKDKDSATYTTIQNAINHLPNSVIESMVVLSKRTEAKIKSTESGINQLRYEIELGFDRTMDRASGVYRRNAKGVAILIGFVIAVAANADTFLIVNRLSRDSALRAIITENAGQILTQNENRAIPDLEGLRREVNTVLPDLSLPIGWTGANLEQQIGWTPGVNRPFPVLRFLGRLPGLILTAIAIAMGAPFWFDLLNKVVNVRNTGKPPAASDRYPVTADNENHPVE